MTNLYKPVRLLNDDLIKKIAAGEVVDRPSSIIKELFENSIDAQSSKISVTVVDGGLKSIEFLDDGFGMTVNDLKLSIKKHATSKVAKTSDLENILSMGFRGEALAAISSVSKFQIISKRSNMEAWKLSVNEKGDSEIVPHPLAKGTKIVIEDLFYNIPARKKFLKTAASELREIRSLLYDLALAQPGIEIHWTFINIKGEVTEQVMLPEDNLKNRFLKISALKYPSVVKNVNQDSILEILANPEKGFVSDLKIYLLKPPFMINKQKGVSFIVNGRVVFDKALAFSLREALCGLIEVGHFPICCVSLKVNPKVIDVNIHPQKKEIRWETGFRIASYVYKYVRPHFEFNNKISDQVKNESLFFQDSESINRNSANIEKNFSREVFSTKTNSENIEFITPKASNENNNLIKQSENKSPIVFSKLKVIGEANACWLICESEYGVVIIDQHAAHERINFEKLLFQDDFIDSMPLLIPCKVNVANKFKKEVIDLLKQFFFEVDEDFQLEDEISITAVPVSKRKINWSEILQNICSDVGNDEFTFNCESLKVKIASSLACHSSIRKGQRLSNNEIKEMLTQLDKLKWVFCPHGRPIHKLIKEQDLESMFHR